MTLPVFPFRTILDWYRNNGRHKLSWRKDPTPYSVWVSEIFLQQTQVSRVESHFTRVMADFPTVREFARLEYEAFFPYYDGLGYYSRARNMLKTAKMIVSQYDGRFPDDYGKLTRLPGIGPYTAQAILAFGFDRPILAFDTNIEKVFARYYSGSRFLKLNRTDKEHLREMLESEDISGKEVNAALMDFSALVDRNDISQIDFASYPLRQSLFFKERGAGEIRTVRSKASPRNRDEVLIVFLHENHKRYFSADPDQFMPFILEKIFSDPRASIKAHFRTCHSLDVSVRPAFDVLERGGRTYRLLNAQIQTGDHCLGEFRPEDCRVWKNAFYEGRPEVWQHIEP